MKKKVLLMGKSGSGKTSMRSIIFANYIARDTRRLGATIDVEHSHVRFLGNLVLNLWDCGGQEAFMENYFASQRDNIFRNVEVLIYVFDVESRELERDMHYYQSCLEAILQNSPEAKIFCLIHKMDLISEDQRDIIFKEREADLKRLSRPLDCTCFRTSIWDETLYRAWSSIVYMLIPNVKELENSLQQFANIVDADEVLLFEKATFLVISHCQRKHHRDVHRFEKVSNIIKQFKLSCSKLAAQFQSMEVRNSAFAAYIDMFTSNTYVMVCMSDPQIPSEVTLINIRNARKHFGEIRKSIELCANTWPLILMLFDEILLLGDGKQPVDLGDKKIMDKLLKGIMKYRYKVKEGMVKQFLEVKDNPKPKAVFFTCIDSRMLPTRFTQTNVGDMFIVRNAGNIIPHSQHFLDELTTNEPAALELGCIVNDVRHIIVCGHSDCKAINLLYQLQDSEFASQDNRRISPLRSWLCTHALPSLEKFQQLELTDYSKPLIFQAETPLRKFVAYIDPENKFNIEDKLSQVNTLQQLQNIASYGFLKRRLETHQLHIHALWFDIYTGEIYYFSRGAKQFIPIDEENFEKLLQEVDKYYS
ncbi:hypothetical protein NQ318_007861 [Aromia moschata]|uniref:Beta carbonic anhydrase 1 n=1 Tax=Aromia moschata TaxID=1265417 RepID=A0AAV8XM12_9CUCU|nr:hypothetical protein NQ318_007861 [Aromia moschata]